MIQIIFNRFNRKMAILCFAIAACNLSLGAQTLDIGGIYYTPVLANTVKVIERVMQKKQSLKMTIVVLVFFLIVFFVLLTFYFINDKKKKEASQYLMGKNQEWAIFKEFPNEKNSPVPESTGNNPPCPEMQESIFLKKQENLIRDLYILLDEKELFLDTDLTLDKASKRLHTNRSYLSRTINRETGHNFVSLLNDYRIKKAVNLLGDPANDKYSIEKIAEAAGFSSRKTFYTVFKKTTGLTPLEFKKNTRS